MVKCFSCGKNCDPDGDLCRGCGKIVCVACAIKYNHMGNGEHGRHRPTTRALDGAKRGAKKSSVTSKRASKPRRSRKPLACTSKRSSHAKNSRYAKR